MLRIEKRLWNRAGKVEGVYSVYLAFFCYLASLFSFINRPL